MTAPKTPAPWRNWQQLPTLRNGEDTYLVFRRGRLRVTSQHLVADFHGQRRAHWLVAVSAGGVRATDEEVARVLRDFEMVGAEEDNHMNGITRSFFRLCDARPGDPSECECKEGEETIVEPDGYRWQRDPLAAEEAGRLAAARVLLGRRLRP